MKPLVSVIVPCFNAAEYITETLNSILAQSFEDFEVIVIDDGSTDQTKEAMRDFGDKVRYIYQENSGPAVARNRGVFEAQGKYLAFCDADDTWEPEKLEKQLDVFQQFPECGMVSTNGVFVDKEGKALGRQIAASDKVKDKVTKVTMEDLLSWAHFYPSATMIKKAVLLKAGVLFDHKSYLFEDVFLRLRIAEIYEAIFLNELLIERKYLPDSLSHKHTKRDRYAQVNVFSLALVDFPDYEKIIKRKLVHSLYSTARLESMDKNFKAARELLNRALRLNSFLGSTYARQQDSYITKIKKFFMPYVLLLCVILKINILKSDW